ncbi:MAG: DUF1153 domain-containing protein [Alphaproteobacteria bacterium]|nr:DUF1153 domain-containing protein [Alphaproteobacteria bacterium]
MNKKKTKKEDISKINLPSPQTKRWVINRKVLVVEAVRTGLITLEEVCQRYSLSVEEFIHWQKTIDRYGPYGLRITRIKNYRGYTSKDKEAN